MKKIIVLLPLLAFCSATQASTSYGTLNNFDTVNDTGQTCHGFEIEIDDIHSSAITYTYDYNHYGKPKIREDNSDPLHSKVFVRYEGVIGSATAFTNPAAPGSITPTNGHQCTNPAINQGCEHFGVGYYGNSSAVKYNWLINDGTGKLIHGPAVSVGTPTWTYQPPVVQPNPDPNLPPVVQFPAQVIAVIPAPVVPPPPLKEFGKPSWVKVIKTTSHKIKPLELKDLISDDKDHDNHPDWTNGEPDEVESEWKLLQTNNVKPDKAELEGNPEELPNGDETVTRRYEFYEYAAGDGSIDGENGEAKCDSVAADDIHGTDIVDVTDANGGSYSFDCASVAVVGNYVGAQMAGFNVVAPFGLIDNIQDGNVAEPFPNRTIPAGGNTPYVTNITAGALPNGLTIQPGTGILYGTPSKVGAYTFTVSASDFDGSSTSKPYSVKITGPGDVDADNDIDLADIAIIKAKYGQIVGAKDPSDLNGDLKINVLDYRKAASLCTRPRCAL